MAILPVTEDVQRLQRVRLQTNRVILRFIESAIDPTVEHSVAERIEHFIYGIPPFIDIFSSAVNCSLLPCIHSGHATVMSVCRRSGQE